MKHAIQTIRPDEHGTLRFTKNSIVAFLLDEGPFDLNGLACMAFEREDWEHFAQLIGYSLDGWGTLSYVNDAAFAIASAQAEDGSATEELENVIEQLQQQIYKAVEILGGEKL